MFVVHAPASSANVGPGFDCIAMALALCNETTFGLTDGELLIEIEGEGVNTLPRDSENLIYQAATALFKAASQPMPSLHLICKNRIPLRRGLGSSAAAIVTGLLGANTILGNPLAPLELLRIATDLDGHPDNVAAALLGGLQISTQCSSEVVSLGIDIPINLFAAICIPDMEIATKTARSVLPPYYSSQDVTFNTSRTALLIAALVQGRLDLLQTAMEDRLHQPYRSHLIPGLHSAIKAAQDAGALGACLSGSGSAILALTTTAQKTIAIGEAMKEALTRSGTSAHWMPLSLDFHGARVEVYSS